MDMPVHGKNTLIDLRELLDLLRRTHPTFPYRLALFSEAEGKGRLADTLRTLCPPIGGQTPCNQPCVQQWEDLIDLSTVSKRPQTHRCQGGFLGFAIPTCQ